MHNRRTIAFLILLAFLALPLVYGRGVAAQSGRPSATRGAEIYAEHCADCHGPAGMGDGEFALSGGLSPTRLADPEFARTNSPINIFETISQGHLDLRMPPWGDLLEEDEIWDVTYHILSMGEQDGEFEAGAGIFAENCAECHGEAGVAEGMPDFSDSATLAGHDREWAFGVISQGSDEMPAFGEELDEDEIWAVTAYLFGLGYERGGTPEPTPTPEPTETPAAGQEAETHTITIRGSVTNGTSGGEVPDDLQIELYIFRRDGSLADKLDVSADENGAYEFTDVPVVEDGFFFTATSYKDISFASAFMRFQPGLETQEVPLLIYEPTDDPSVISIQSTQIDLQFGEGVMTVGQVMQFVNSSDRVYTTDRTVEVETGDGIRHVSLEIPLPPGAFGVAFQAGTGSLGVRYHFQDGAVLDTMAVRPGTVHEIAFSYMLPYENGAVIEWELPYDADNIHLFLPHVGVTLTGEQFREVGNMENAPYTTYMAGPIDAGSVLHFELSGSPRVGGREPAPMGGFSGAVIGVIVAVAVIAITLIFMLLTGKGRSAGETPTGEEEPPESGAETVDKRDELVRAIAELDDEFERGEIPESEYRVRRKELKDELSRLMRGEQ